MAVDLKHNTNFGDGDCQGDRKKVLMKPLYCTNVRTNDNYYMTG